MHRCLALLLACLAATLSMAQTLDDRHLTIVPRTAAEAARIAGCWRPP